MSSTPIKPARFRLGGMPKDLRVLVGRAVDFGARVHRLGSGHIGVRFPNGAFVVVSSSPSDHRAIHNVRAAFRRAGLT